MINIRDKCREWSNKTFRQELESLNIKNKDLLNNATQCFIYLGILDKNINGYACEKLPKTEEGHTGLKVTYSEIFHNCIAEENFSPVTYILKIVQEFLKPNINKDKLNGAVARGLRTFTSLLREPDFAYNIEQYLRPLDSTITMELNPKQDGGDHTDILLRFMKNQYRLWLYQFSSRGLPHDIERVSGKRGELPSGTHILCPLHTEVALSYDSNKRKVDKLIEKIEKDKELLNNCSTKAIKKRDTLEKRIQKNSIQLDNVTMAKEKDYILCSDELDIVEGWFFYSDKHLKRIADFIINKPSIDNYEHVKQILSAPEKYLSEVRIFNK